MHAFYEESAAGLSKELKAGRSVALIAEGDPMFYGSFMHLWRRLSAAHPVEIVPGITGLSGAAARAGIGLAWGDDVLTILPGTLPEAELARRLALSDGVVVMKIGRHLAKVRRALVTAGMAERAVYVERATMAGEAILPLAGKSDNLAPYFSMIIVPGQGRAL
jgi:precorrin-2/cobalt-factor-2 C20-methyltransferase